jgi:hypothetical protein
VAKLATLQEKQIAFRCNGFIGFLEVGRDNMVTLDRAGMSRTDAGLEWYSHILAYGFALHFFFGSVSILNALELGFFYYFPRRIQLTIITARFDVLVWALSLTWVSILAIWLLRKDMSRRAVQAVVAVLTVALVAALLLNPLDILLCKLIVYVLFAVATANFAFLARRSESIPEGLTRILVSRTLIYSLVILTAIEISSGIHYVLQSFDRMTPLGKVDAGIELQFSYLSYGLLPWLYLGFLFSWAWIPLVRRLGLRARVFRSNSETTSTCPAQVLAESAGRSRLSALLDPRLFVTLAVVVFIGYYPYFQNPPWLVGTDAYWRYFDPLLRMNAQGLAGGFVQVLKERHPLPLALLYAGQLIFRTTAFEIVRIAPLFLVAALALATWWFLAGKKRIEFGLIVALFSVFSVTTTVGLFSSILANWMALVVWVLYFAYTASMGDEKTKVLDVIVLLSMSTLILFIHPWTWGVFAVSVLLFAFMILFREKRGALSVAAVSISVVVIDALLALVSLILLGGSEGWRIAEALELYTTVASDPASLLVFWDALTRLTQVWAAFFSPLSLAVSILGVFYLYSADVTVRRRCLILAWICASSIGSLLVAPIGYNLYEPARGESQIWRLLFLTPFQLTLPFGVALIMGFLKALQTTSASQKSLQRASMLARGIFLSSLFVIGFLLAWAPAQWRPGLILIALPAVTGLCLAKSVEGEKQLVSDVVLLLLLLIGFNYATRSLAQLLIDPHNYRP